MCVGLFGNGRVNKDTFLYGTYLQIGVNAHGVFGTNERCNPSACHWGLKNSLGLLQDVDGWSTGAKPQTGDFFLPGAPFYMFCVGFNHPGSPSITSMCNNRNGGNPLGEATVTDESSASKKELRVKLHLKKSPIQLDAVYSFHACSKKIRIQARITNIGHQPINDPYYAISIDPDQDCRSARVGCPGTHNTRDSIRGQKTHGDPYTSVCGEGQNSKISVCMSSASPKSKAYRGLTFNHDPVQHKRSVEIAGSGRNGDNAIALATHGPNSLAPGSTTADVGMFFGMGSMSDIDKPEDTVCE